MNDGATDASRRTKRAKISNRLRNMSFSERVMLIIALIALAIAMIGVPIMLAQLFFTAAGPLPCGIWKECATPSSAPPPGTPPQAPTDQSAGSGKDESVLAVGTCIADGATVPCDSPHQEQIYAHDDCSPEKLIRFLGGNPAIDVLRPDLVTEKRENRECSVHVPGGIRWSAQNVLPAASGTVWRWCHNSLTDRDVPCSEAHDGEVVSSSPRPRDDELDCRADAETYMDRGWSGVNAELMHEVVEHEAADLCLVRPRGNNSLNGSIRRIGTRTLPLGDPL